MKHLVILFTRAMGVAILAGAFFTAACEEPLPSEDDPECNCEAGFSCQDGVCVEDSTDTGLGGNDAVTDVVDAPDDATDEPPPDEDIFEPEPDNYPPAPWGMSPGSIIKNHVFRDPANDVSVKLSQLYNPKGSGDKTVLIINASAGWCSACKVEAKELQKTYAEYGPQGLEIWFTLFQDFTGEDATDEFWEAWMNLIDPNYPTLLDTAFELGPYFNVDATPMNMVVDLATMEIVYLQTGFDEVGVTNQIVKYLK